jgi:hypothetical protein
VPADDLQDALNVELRMSPPTPLNGDNRDAPTRFPDSRFPGGSLYAIRPRRAGVRPPS